MPSQLMMLAALLLVASGAPVGDGHADVPAGGGDPSGEEEALPSDLLSASPVWHSLLGATNRHQKEFEDEFQLRYDFLVNYKISSLPASCPHTNFSKEACLHRLVQGLRVYMVLLKHVEKEFPGSLICSEARFYSGLLISLTKEKMKKPEKVTPLTGSQETQLLKDVDNPDPFHRKMTTHSVLRELHNFLVDCKRAIAKRERSGGSSVTRNMSPISSFNQL